MDGIRAVSREAASFCVLGRGRNDLLYLFVPVEGKMRARAASFQ